MSKNSKLLSLSALVSTLGVNTIDYNNTMFENVGIIRPIDFENNDEDDYKLLGSSGSVESITLHQDYNSIIRKIATQYSSLYGASIDDCISIINDNIDYILSSDDKYEAISNVIKVNLALSDYKIEKYESPFKLGTGNITYINEFKETKQGRIYKECCDAYGIDYNYALAMSKQEANLNHEAHLPGGRSFNGYAYGISQIEYTLIGTEFQAYNFETGKVERIKIVKNYPTNKEPGITYLSVMNFSDNVRIGVAKLQQKLTSYNYNLPLATQAYNYGGAIKLVLNKYVSVKGISKSKVINNPTDLGWIKYVKDFHNNPTSYGIKWSHGTYGDDDYINHVFQYIPTQILEFTTKNKEKIYINLQSQIVVRIDMKEFERNIEILKESRLLSTNNLTFAKVMVKSK